MVCARCSHARASAHPRTSPEVCARMRPGCARMHLRGGPALNRWLLLPIILFRAVSTTPAGKFSASSCYDDARKSRIPCLYVRAEALLRSSTLSPCPESLNPASSLRSLAVRSLLKLVPRCFDTCSFRRKAQAQARFDILGLCAASERAEPKAAVIPGRLNAPNTLSET